MHKNVRLCLYIYESSMCMVCQLKWLEMTGTYCTYPDLISLPPNINQKKMTLPLPLQETKSQQGGRVFLGWQPAANPTAEPVLYVNT